MEHEADPFNAEFADPAVEPPRPARSNGLRRRTRSSHRARRKVGAWVVAAVSVLLVLAISLSAIGYVTGFIGGEGWLPGALAPASIADAPTVPAATVTPATAFVAPALIGGYWMAPIASDAPPAPSSIDPAQYVREYAFDQPEMKGAGLGADEARRLAVMLPFALAATARWDARYGSGLEPQMLLFWTHSEGIGGRVSYSNCANEPPPNGLSYFQHIANCDTPSFWQLGFGNQFGRIAILKTAFIDMRGDPNDAQLVRRVGQAVLDWDQKQGTVPRCGGYSCAFPAMTIDQIMAGVSLTNATQDNWWASVLSRDPAINCYMLARTLMFFNHVETKSWVGCYYAEPCWQRLSDSLGDVLVSWPDVLRAARLG